MSFSEGFPERPNGFEQFVAFYPVRDLEESTRFYREILGLELVRDQGSCRIFRVQGDAYIGFCSHIAQDLPGTVIITLVTPEVDAWHRYLTSLGIPCSSPPTHNSTFNIYHAFYRDPDDYNVEIQRFDDPLGRST